MLQLKRRPLDVCPTLTIKSYKWAYKGFVFYGTRAPRVYDGGAGRLA